MVTVPYLFLETLYQLEYCPALFVIKVSYPADYFLRFAAKKLRSPPSACVGFEDSTAGLMGLHAAGIRSIFIKDVLSPP